MNGMATRETEGLSSWTCRGLPSCTTTDISASNMMTSSNGNIFRVTGHLCGEFTVNSPHKGQWRRALMFSLICVLINGWVNNGEGDDLRRYRAHYDVTVMSCFITTPRGAMPSIYRAINLALCSHQMETFSVLLALCVGNPPDSHWNYHSLSHALSHRTKSDHQVPRSTRSYLS